MEITGSARMITIAAIISAAAPLSTGVYEYLRGENTFRLKEQEQNHDVRTFYLQKAIESEAEVTRVRYLRYLASTEFDNTFKQWASSELTITENKVNELKQERDVAIRKASDLERKIEDVELSLKSVEVQRDVERLKKLEAERIALENKQKLAKAEAQYTRLRLEGDRQSEKALWQKFKENKSQDELAKAIARIKN